MKSTRLPFAASSVTTNEQQEMGARCTSYGSPSSFVNGLDEVTVAVKPDSDVVMLIFASGCRYSPAKRANCESARVICSGSGCDSPRSFAIAHFTIADAALLPLLLFVKIAIA